MGQISSKRNKNNISKQNSQFEPQPQPTKRRPSLFRRTSKLRRKKLDEEFLKMSINGSSITTKAKSVFEDDREDSSTACSSEYRYLDGRQFHYMEPLVLKFVGSILDLPMNLEELDHGSISHFISKALWQGNFHGPIEGRLIAGNAKVLDSCCGGGSWTIDMASTYPFSEFAGIDIVPVIPKDSIPLNASFLQMDLFDGLQFPNGHFDFVHQRYMASAFTRFQFSEKIIPELLRITKSGGILEFVEMDLEWKSPGPLLRYMANTCSQFLTRRGIDLNPGFRLAEALRDTKQLIDLHHEVLYAQMGKSHGKLGELMAQDMLQASISQRSLQAPLLKISCDAYEQMIKALFTTEVDQYNTCIPIHRIYGTKV
ncbi:hypothetical protein G9A89_023005 [Geosiphon pyriformis]|nr:hypothetical protein G9A89_023005 [Geosiphon pyriformis]